MTNTVAVFCNTVDIEFFSLFSSYTHSPTIRDPQLPRNKIFKIRQLDSNFNQLISLNTRAEGGVVVPIPLHLEILRPNDHVGIGASRQQSSESPRTLFAIFIANWVPPAITFRIRSSPRQNLSDSVDHDVSCAVAIRSTGEGTTRSSGKIQCRLQQNNTNQRQIHTQIFARTPVGSPTIENLST